MSRRGRCLAVLAVLLIVREAPAADHNHFASIYLDGDKIGQVHYTVRYDEKGQVEELRTRASISILGIKLFHFTQHLHEMWKDGELQRMRGHTDDDGDVYEASVERNPTEYDAVLNSKSLTLPPDAFPTSVWHYQITQKSLLFNLEDLRLMKVKVVKSEDSVSVGKRSIPATRFDFSGDWNVSVWYDQNRQLLKTKHKVKGKDVVVTMDAIDDL